MNMKETILRTAAAATAAVLLFCGQVRAMPETSAESAILMDAATGRVLYEENADERCLIASTTKIMTGLLVCEAGKLDQIVSVPSEAVGVEGSSMYLKPGEKLTRRDLLFGLMLSSGNDAAVALAIVVSGSVPQFVLLMNNRAERVGVLRNHFANPNGLDSEENFSTSRELAVLAAAAMKNSTFQSIVSQKSAQAAGRTLTNHNRMLWEYEGADGVKTGYTIAAGRILVSSAVRRGRRLIAVTVRDRDDWRDHAAMLDFGFSLLRETPILDAGRRVGEIRVLSGEKAYSALCVKEPLSVSVFPGEKPELQLRVPDFCFAPIRSGQAAGYLEIKVGTAVLSKQTVYYAEEVLQAEQKHKSLWQRIFGGSYGRTASKDTFPLWSGLPPKGGRAHPSPACPCEWKHRKSR